MDAITEGSPINDPKKQPMAMRALLGRTAKDWWPEQLPLDILLQNGGSSNPMSRCRRCRCPSRSAPITGRRDCR